MSRKGKLPIPLPKGVAVDCKNHVVTVKGPKGTLTQEIKPGVELRVEDGEIHVVLAEGVENFGKFHGLYRSLIANLVIGVTEGFKKELQMIGVGYRAAVQGKLLDLQIGISHPLKMTIPEGIKVTIEKMTAITIEGIDKHQVGQFAAAIREHRKPEPYKGKGIRYVDEFVRKKAGKTAKS